MASADNNKDKVAVLTADANSPRLSRTALRALSSNIAAAFADDPVFRYYLRISSSSSTSSSSFQSHSNDRIAVRLRPMFTACVRHASRHTRPTKGTYIIHYTSDYSSAAIWAFDGIWRDRSGQLAGLFNMLRTFGFTQLLKCISMFTQVETQHPHDDDSMNVNVIPSLTEEEHGKGQGDDSKIRAPRHAYLWIVGTNPKQQGKGLGSRVVGEMLKQLDERNMPAYLETTSEKNIPFYQRLGFKTVRRLGIDDDMCPPIWAMWRVPGGENGTGSKGKEQ